MPTDAELRQAALADWVQSHGGHAEVVRKYSLTPSRASYLSQCINGAVFREKAAENWERDLRMPPGMLKHPRANGAPSENSGNREISTAENIGMPRKEGHTTTVNQPPEGVKADSITELPLLPWGMIDRIGMPNKDIQGMVLVTLPFASTSWDAAHDKIVVVPDTSLGPRFEMGDHLIMRPVKDGEAIEPGRLPVLVRLPDGTHALTAYNALQVGLNKLVVVAICKQFFSPPPP